jgi:hypothetical protein
VTNPRVPRPAPGIPTAALPPRAKQITLPGVPRPATPELDAVTEIQRPPSRQDARSEATDTPIGPLGARPGSRSQGQREPRSMSPALGTPESVIPQLRAAVEQQGDRLERVPESPVSSYPAATPLVVNRPRQPPWWEREDAVIKVIGAVVAGALALGGAGLLARGSGEPAPVKQGDIECPAFGDDKTPRGALCTRIHELEGMLGRLQAIENSRTAAAEREKKMLGQEPPKLKP